MLALHPEHVPVLADICRHLHTRTKASGTAVQGDAEGSYAGFDPEEYTSRSGGKLQVAKHLKVTPLPHVQLAGIPMQLQIIRCLHNRPMPPHSPLAAPSWVQPKILR